MMTYKDGDTENTTLLKLPAMDKVTVNKSSSCVAMDKAANLTYQTLVLNFNVFPFSFLFETPPS